MEWRKWTCPLFHPHESRHVDQGKGRYVSAFISSILDFDSKKDTVYHVERPAYQAQSDFLRKAGITGTKDQLLASNLPFINDKLSQEMIRNLAYFFELYDVMNPAIIP